MMGIYLTRHGYSEFRNHLSDEVLYGFVRVEDRFILITWVSEQVRYIILSPRSFHMQVTDTFLSILVAYVEVTT